MMISTGNENSQIWATTSQSSISNGKVENTGDYVELNSQLVLGDIVQNDMEEGDDREDDSAKDGSCEILGKNVEDNDVEGSGNEDASREEDPGDNNEEQTNDDMNSQIDAVPGIQRERRVPNLVFVMELVSSDVCAPSVATSEAITPSPLCVPEESEQLHSSASFGQGTETTTSLASDILEDSEILISNAGGSEVSWKLLIQINSLDGIRFEDNNETDRAKDAFIDALQTRFDEFLYHVQTIDRGAITENSLWRLECFQRKGSLRSMDVNFVRTLDVDNKERPKVSRYRSKEQFEREFKEREKIRKRKEREASRRMKSESGGSPPQSKSPSTSTIIKRRPSKRVQELKRRQEAVQQPKRMTRASLKESLTLPPAKKTREKSPAEKLADLIGDAKRVIVILGAGVSTAAGLPDFRTKSTGLYSAIASGKLGKDALPAELLFHAETFEQDPVPFYQFATKTFMPLLEAAKPTLSHQFVRLLMNENKLLRCYTQNVDGLEKNAGVEDKFLIMCHGTLRSGRCMRCRTKVSEPFWWQAKTETNKGVPECVKQGCKGDLRPEMIFFGEEVPAIIECRLEHDVKKCDLVMVMGTSLSVRPVSEILTMVPEDVPRVWINRAVPTQEADYEFAVTYQGDCDEAIDKVVRRLRWWG